MSVRTNLLKIINDVYREKGEAVCLQDIKDFLGVGESGSSRLSTATYDLAAKYKYLKIDKKLSLAKKNYYAVTALGAKTAKSTATTMTIDELREWVTESSPPEKTPPLKYSKQANMAIGSIADLVDTNERLINTIRSIHLQLGNILRDHDEQSAE